MTFHIADQSCDSFCVAGTLFGEVGGSVFADVGGCLLLLRAL